MKFLHNNLVIRILSLVLAIFLWATIVFVQNPYADVTIKNIPIKVVGIEALSEKNLCIKNVDVKTVNIRIRGLRLQLINLNTTNITCNVDVGSIIRGDAFSLPISVFFPYDNITILERTPYHANVVIEEAARVTLPINIVYSGNNKDASLYHSASISPAEIDLYGPKSDISNISAANVNVNLSEADKSSIFEQNIDFETEKSADILNNEYIIKSATKTMVNCTVLNTKTVPIVPSIVGGIPDEVSYELVSTEPSEIRIAGDKDALANISAVYTNEIDLSKYSHTRDVNISTALILPPGIVLAENIEPYAKLHFAFSAR